jgi:nitrate/nitrite transporter NarK
LFVSPIFSGWVKDHYGSYDLVFVIFIPLYVASAVLFGLSTRPPPPKLERTDMAEPERTAAAG